MPKTITGLTTSNSTPEIVQGPLLTVTSQPSSIPGNPPNEILTFDNSPDFLGSVTVDGSMTTQSLAVQTSTSTADLTVTNSASIDNDLTVYGSTAVGPLDVANSLAVQGSITVQNDITVNNILSVPNGRIYFGPVGSIETNSNNLEIAVSPAGSILLKYNAVTVITINDVVTISKALRYPINFQHYSMSGLQGVPANSAQRMGQFSPNTIPSIGPDILTLVTGNAWRNDFSFPRVVTVTYSGSSIASSSPSEYSIKSDGLIFTRSTASGTDFCSISCDLILYPTKELWIEVFNFSGLGQNYGNGRVSITVQ